jgi:hypothetical protein
MILRFLLVLLLLAGAGRAQSVAEAQQRVPTSVRVVKVLHHLVDAQGRIALAPSLFERDAYQVHLREFPKLVASSRFDIQYKARRKDGPVRLRLEIRGSKTGLGNSRAFEAEAMPDRWGSSWGRIALDKKTSDEVGTIVAWRCTLSRDGVQIAEQQSFLW